MTFSALSASAAWDAAKEFKTNCMTCHSVGGGDKIGPDLAGVTERRNEKWLVKYIQYPSGMMEGDAEEPGYEEADEIAAELWKAYKPNMMAEQDLTEDQIKKLMAHIKTLSKGKSPKGKITKITGSSSKSKEVKKTQDSKKKVEKVKKTEKK